MVEPLIPQKDAKEYHTLTASKQTPQQFLEAETKKVIEAAEGMKLESQEEEKELTLEEESKLKSEFEGGMKSIPSELQVRDENDVRIAIIGNVDSGKSTLVGVLTKGIFDDGRGSARKAVFNFAHEASNGRTSSIGQEILGFTEEGKVVEPERLNSTKNQTWSHIAKTSKKIITFLDLCGHEKYLKTTMFGLVGLMPDYSMIVVGANMGVSRMTREHLGISLALKVPIFIVITKVDIAPPEVYEETKNSLIKILKSPVAQKMPQIVKKGDNIQPYAEQLANDKLCPIFTISNVTGEGLEELKDFMKLLSSRISISGLFKKPTDPVEFLIDGIYQVTGVGLVVAGTMKSGTVEPNQLLQLGPDKLGNFK